MGVVDRWLQRFLGARQAPDAAARAGATGTHDDDERGRTGIRSDGGAALHMRTDDAAPADPLDAALAKARARLSVDAAGRRYAESADLLAELRALDGGGRSKAADELLADALLCTPSTSLRRLLAERLLYRGERARARALLLKLQDDEQHGTWALSALGELAEQDGDVDAAVAYTEAVLARDITLEQPKARARRLRAGREGRSRADEGRSALARFLGAKAAGARYAVVDEIGRGGAATVFRARDRVIDREVALKIFHPRGNPHERRARLVEEARIAGAFDHPHVVPVLDLDEERDLLVMVLCDGGSLQRRVQTQGKLRHADAVELGAVLLRTLADIHDSGQVHLDIKPSNLLFHGGQLMVCDFGTAGLRELGAAAGTRAYMAPELLGGSHVDDVNAARPAAHGNTGDLRAADLYAAGLVIAEAIEGRLPARGAIALPTLPAGPRRRALEHVLSRLVHDDVAQRPRTGREAAEWLLEAGALPLSDDEGRHLFASIEMRARREGDEALLRVQAHPIIAALRGA